MSEVKTNIILDHVILSHIHALSKNKRGEYSVTILIPKSDEIRINDIKTEIKDVIKQYKSQFVTNKKYWLRDYSMLNTIFTDGSSKRVQGYVRDIFKDYFVIYAYVTYKPAVIDEYGYNVMSEKNLATNKTGKVCFDLQIKKFGTRHFLYPKLKYVQIY